MQPNCLARRLREPEDRRDSTAKRRAALLLCGCGSASPGRERRKRRETMRDSASLHHGTMASQPVSPGKAQAGTDDRYNAGLTDAPTAQ